MKKRKMIYKISTLSLSIGSIITPIILTTACAPKELITDTLKEVEKITDIYQKDIENDLNAIIIEDYLQTNNISKNTLPSKIPTTIDIINKARSKETTIRQRIWLSHSEDDDINGTTRITIHMEKGLAKAEKSFQVTGFNHN